MRAPFLFCLAILALPVPAFAAETIIRVTSPFASGSGSIREAITVANASPKATRIVSALPPGTVVYVYRELPALVGFGTQLDGNGLVLKGGSCVRSDGRRGCSGLVVEGPLVTVRNLAATGFLFDGIAVRQGAMNTKIEECHCYGNQDDGIGVSAGATDVVVERCVLEGNGFRSKGKGILVFDYAQATLRDNTVRANRDGVTVSRGARAVLINNTIEDNYDKGLGVIGAEATGSGNTIRRNGLQRPNADPAPNADGLRVTSDSTVRLTDTEISQNGDDGVVVLGASVVDLSDSHVRGNRGVGVLVRDQARLRLRETEVTENVGGPFSIEGEGKIERIRPGEAAADREDEDADRDFFDVAPPPAAGD